MTTISSLVRLFSGSLFKTALFLVTSRIMAIFSCSTSPVVFGGGSQTGPKNLSGTFSCTIRWHAAHKTISSISSSAIFTSELRFTVARDCSDNAFEMWSKHRFRCVYISEAGDRQLCAVSCLQNRVPMELLLPLH